MYFIYSLKFNIIEIIKELEILSQLIEFHTQYSDIFNQCTRVFVSNFSTLQVYI